jgi:hypothetical protein
MPTRAELHEAVDTLPEESFEQAMSMLRHLKDGPPKPPPPGRDAAFARVQERRQERHQAMLARLQSQGKGMIAGFSGGGSSVGPDGKRQGRYSFGYVDDDGTQAYETSIIKDNHELRITERLNVGEASNTMTVRLDLLGPDGTVARFDHTFGLNKQKRDKNS